MPFYRISGMVVHIRGTKLPQPCGARVWLDGREALCLAFSGFLCDFPDGGGHTCDRALCDAHAHQVGKDRHHCPAHRAEAESSQPQRGLFTQLLHGVDGAS